MCCDIDFAIFVGKKSTFKRVSHSQNDEDGSPENSLFLLTYSIISVTKLYDDKKDSQ